MIRRVRGQSSHSRTGTGPGQQTDRTNTWPVGTAGSPSGGRPDRLGSLLSPDAPFQAFALATSSSPRVTIVVAMHAKPGWTLACLHSIARAGDVTPFEVIVVSDNQHDDVRQHLHQISGLRVVAATPGDPPAEQRNAGARAARGELLLFMDDTAQATPGWLDQLRDCLDHEADCGMAGSRIVGADTRLLSAGGIIHADGTCRDAGRAEHRDDPHYRCRRDVDYLSGSALMIERRLFESVGGFNARYALACHRDADLGLCVRAAGRRAIYAPSSVVLCGHTASTPDSSPSGNPDENLDRQALARAWPDELTHQFPSNAPLASVLWRHHPHILVIDTATPDPTRDPPSRRLATIFRLLHHLGWKVSFLPLAGQATGPQVDLLGGLGVCVWRQPFARDVSVWLHTHRSDIQAVMLCGSEVAATCLPLMRQHIPHARILFDTVDLRFPRELRAAEMSGNTALARQAQLSGERELALVEACDATLAADPAEHDLIVAHVPSAQVELLPGMHVPHAPERGAAGRRGVLYIGNGDPQSNSDALQWLAREILPRVGKVLSDIELHLFRLQTDIPDALRKVCAVHVHDDVAELDPWLQRCRVLVAPMRYGTGMMGRINTAMSCGLPVVATSIASAGMNLVDGRNVLIGDDAAAFAAAVIRACQDDALWLNLSTEGLANVERHFSVRAACAALRHALPA